MKTTSLDEVYASVNKDAGIIYVVPLIRYSYSETDYLYLLYKDLIESGKYDIIPVSIFNHFELVTGAVKNKNAILHYHWLEFQDLKSLAGMPWKLACIYLFKLFGGNIVWTLHNEFPHDQKYLGLHQFLHNKMARWADILHIHCAAAAEIMSRRLEIPASRFRLIPHPEFPSNSIPKEEAISNLNMRFQCSLSPEIPILLMFGNISRYKQIEKVAQLVPELDRECKLLVAGPVKKGNMGLYKELLSFAEKHSRFEIIPEFIAEECVPWFYSASDICVFNYREILSSGGYHMAKAYNKMIIAPDMGCLSEEGNEDGVYLFHHQNELKELLNSRLKSV